MGGTGLERKFTSKSSKELTESSKSQEVQNPVHILEKYPNWPT